MNVGDKLVINITARDIAEGLVCEPTACPVARALSRKAGEGAHVDSDTAYLSRATLSGPGLRPFVDAFDTGMTVKPQRMTLTVVEVTEA